MKNLIPIFVIGFIVSGCDHKTNIEAERQARTKDLYQVPPPSDPAEDQWAKPGTTNPTPKEQ